MSYFVLGSHGLLLVGGTRGHCRENYRDMTSIYKTIIGDELQNVLKDHHFILHC